MGRGGGGAGGSAQGLGGGGGNGGGRGARRHPRPNARVRPAGGSGRGSRGWQQQTLGVYRPTRRGAPSHRPPPPIHHTHGGRGRRQPPPPLPPVRPTGPPQYKVAPVTRDRRAGFCMKRGAQGHPHPQSSLPTRGGPWRAGRLRKTRGPQPPHHPHATSTPSSNKAPSRVGDAPLKGGGCRGGPTHIVPTRATRTSPPPLERPAPAHPNRRGLTCRGRRRRQGPPPPPSRR